jgi:hypothetical protein
MPKGRPPELSTGDTLLKCRELFLSWRYRGSRATEECSRWGNSPLDGKNSSDRARQRPTKQNPGRQSAAKPFLLFHNEREEGSETIIWWVSLQERLKG